MNFKTIGLNAAVATAVVAGSALTISPAQAASFNLSGNNSLSSVTASGFSFTGGTANFAISDGDGIFSSYNGGTATVKSLPSLAPTTEFIKLTKTGFSDIVFNLTSATSLEFTSVPNGGFLPFNFNLTSATPGLETGAGGGAATLFSVSTSVGSVNVNSFTVSATAVPTPALLPGLLALGVGILRKRKAEATEAVEADA